MKPHTYRITTNILKMDIVVVNKSEVNVLRRNAEFDFEGGVSAPYWECRGFFGLDFGAAFRYSKRVCLRLKETQLEGDNSRYPVSAEIVGYETQPGTVATVWSPSDPHHHVVVSAFAV